jgi:hypothetical protein
VHSCCKGFEKQKETGLAEAPLNAQLLSINAISLVPATRGGMGPMLYLLFHTPLSKIELNGKRILDIKFVNPFQNVVLEKVYNSETT